MNSKPRNYRQIHIKGKQIWYHLDLEKTGISKNGKLVVEPGMCSTGTLNKSLRVCAPSLYIAGIYSACCFFP